MAAMPPSRPNLFHGLSAHFRLHRSGDDERQPLLSSSRRASTAPVTSTGHTGDGAQVRITIGDEDVEEDDSEHADSDGLYPPHSCWTGQVGGGERADPFQTRECNVYLNIHR